MKGYEYITPGAAEDLPASERHYLVRTLKDLEEDETPGVEGPLWMFGVEDRPTGSVNVRFTTDFLTAVSVLNETSETPSTTKPLSEAAVTTYVSESLGAAAAGANGAVQINDGGALAEQSGFAVDTAALDLAIPLSVSIRHDLLPTNSLVSEDFAGGSLGTFTAVGDASPTPTTRYGNECLELGGITHGQTVGIEQAVTVPDDGFQYVVKINADVDSEDGYDGIRVVIDGTPANLYFKSGEDSFNTVFSGAPGPSWRYRHAFISSGQHTVRVEYYKDGTVSAGEDKGWLNTVTIERLYALDGLRFVDDQGDDAAVLNSLGDFALAGNISAANLLISEEDQHVITGSSRAGENTDGDKLASSTVVGYKAAEDVDPAVSSVTAFGFLAYRYGTGSYPAAVGHQAGRGARGDYLVAMGYLAGVSAWGDDAIAIGREAVYSTGTDHHRLIGIGRRALYDNQGGSDTIGIGYIAGYQNAGSRNVLMGFYTGLNFTGDDSVGIGGRALEAAEGSDLIALGYEAGDNATSSDSIFLGRTAGFQADADGLIAIGKGMGRYETVDYTFTVGHLDTGTLPLLHGNMDTKELTIGDDSLGASLKIARQFGQSTPGLLLTDYAGNTLVSALGPQALLYGVQENAQPAAHLEAIGAAQILLRSDLAAANGGFFDWTLSAEADGPFRLAASQMLGADVDVFRAARDGKLQFGLAPADSARSNVNAARLDARYNVEESTKAFYGEVYAAPTTPGERDYSGAFFWVESEYGNDNLHDGLLDNSTLTGIQADVLHGATSPVQRIQGIRGTAHADWGAGAADEVRGIYFYAQSDADVAQVKGLEVGVGGWNGTDDVHAGAYFRLETYKTVTTRYGLWIEGNETSNVTGADWAIYSDTPGYSYFQGGITVGDETRDALLRMALPASYSDPALRVVDDVGADRFLVGAGGEVEVYSGRSAQDLASVPDSEDLLHFFDTTDGRLSRFYWDTSGNLRWLVSAGDIYIHPEGGVGSGTVHLLTDLRVGDPEDPASGGHIEHSGRIDAKYNPAEDLPALWLGTGTYNLASTDYFGVNPEAGVAFDNFIRFAQDGSDKFKVLSDGTIWSRQVPDIEQNVEALAIGRGASVVHRAVAIGVGASSGSYGTAIGRLAHNQGLGVSLGRSASTSVNYASAIGHGASGDHANSMALGRGAQTTQDNGLSVGSDTYPLYGHVYGKWGIGVDPTASLEVQAEVGQTDPLFTLRDDVGGSLLDVYPSGTLTAAGDVLGANTQPMPKSEAEEGTATTQRTINAENLAAGIAALAAGGLEIVDTEAAILATTPSKAALAFATDDPAIMLYDGSQWHKVFSVMQAVSSVLAGSTPSHPWGYNEQSIWDKVLAACRLGTVGRAEEGGLRVGADPAGNPTFEFHAKGVWNTVLYFFEVQEDGSIQYQPGEAYTLKLDSGDSVELNANGDPIVSNFSMNIGAY